MLKYFSNIFHDFRYAIINAGKKERTLQCVSLLINLPASGMQCGVKYSSAYGTECRGKNRSVRSFRREAVKRKCQGMHYRGAASFHHSLRYVMYIYIYIDATSLFFTAFSDIITSMKISVWSRIRCLKSHTLSLIRLTFSFVRTIIVSNYLDIVHILSHVPTYLLI